MRRKNVIRAAHALYLSQADDKNKILSSFVKNSAPEARKLVEDQGRALILLEKIVLPYGKDAYEEEEMTKILFKKLKKRGHRIQEDDAEDDEEYTIEKSKWEESRKTKVPTLFGKTPSDFKSKGEQAEEVLSPQLGYKPVSKLKLRQRPKAAIILLCKGHTH